MFDGCRECAFTHAPRPEARTAWCTAVLAVLQVAYVTTGSVPLARANANWIRFASSLVAKLQARRAEARHANDVTAAA